MQSECLYALQLYVLPSQKLYIEPRCNKGSRRATGSRSLVLDVPFQLHSATTWLCFSDLALNNIVILTVLKNEIKYIYMFHVMWFNIHSPMSLIALSHPQSFRTS